MRLAAATAAAWLRPSPGAGSEAHASGDGLSPAVCCAHPLDAWPGTPVGPSSAHAAFGPETVAPQPVGEYAQSVLARERIFEHFSRRYETPVAHLRLNYAIDLRYGVLLDIGSKVFIESDI